MIEVIHTKSITINTCLWECSVYIGICKEFTSNLNGILQNNFHHLTRLNKYTFNRSILVCNGHFDHWFSNTKIFKELKKKVS